MLSTSTVQYSPSSAHLLSYDLPNADAVVVTPYDGGAAPLDDVAFPARCAFSWQSVIVTRSAPTGRLSFKTYRNIACFDPQSLSRYPRVGDHITRTWDGARFRVVDVSRRSARELVCDVTEINSVQ